MQTNKKTGKGWKSGYEAYDQFERMPGITVHGCWSHVRRKFVDSLEEDEQFAMEGRLFIRKLYKVESYAGDKYLSAEERMEQRRKISYSAILVFEKWIEETYTKVLPKSRFGDALTYTHSILPRLSHYVNDGIINIDNDLIGNAIRTLTLGRKNYLFCGNDASISGSHANGRKEYRLDNLHTTQTKKKKG